MHMQEPSPKNALSDNRDRNTTPFTLIEVERAKVQIRLGDDQSVDQVFSAGPMRELCPHCMSNHLNLVLRQKRVQYAHLFCECCNRCFEAKYPDGSSALDLDE